MGSALTNTQIKNSYLDVCQLGNSGVGITSALHAICDGSGTASPLQISTLGVREITHSAIGPDSAINGGSIFSVDTSTYQTLLTMQEEFTNCTTDYINGNFVNLLINPSSTPTADVFGIDFEVWTGTGNLQDFSGIAITLVYTIVNHNANSNIAGLYGAYYALVNNGSGTVSEAIANSPAIINGGSGHITTAYASYSYLRGGAHSFGDTYYYWMGDPRGVDGNHFGVYMQDASGFGGTNAYYEWFDSRGVRRVREDPTFNSVGQAIEALYNPQFTKYTPGSANFERVVLGQWVSNVAEIGNEKGGTGTLRPLRFIGAGVQVAVSGASGPDASAAFQVDSTTQGLVVPRMTTTQKNAISSPLEGMIVYDTSLHKLCVRTAATWETITSS